MNNRRFIANLIEAIIGIILIVCGHIGLIDEYWSGMGTALIFISLLMFVRQLRYKTNSDYKEKVDIEVTDERNKYLRRMAWSWSGYLFLLIAAFGSIIFKVCNMDTYSIVCGLAVCLLISLYWISYVILRKKY